MNETAYTFKVTATNGTGSSLLSAASSSITPRSVPESPTNVTAVRGNGQATVSWIAPSNGGSALTNYIITVCDAAENPVSPAQTTTITDPTLLAIVADQTVSFTVTGLMNETAYTFKVTATNATGSSLLSAASSPIPITLTNSGSTDTFIAKYDYSCRPHWGKSIGGTLADQAVNMISDAAGNVYVAGYFNSPTLTIAGVTGPITLTNSGSSDTYIVKYDSLGQAQWAKSIGGTLGDQPVNMELDAQGNLYVAGYFNSPTLTIPGVTGPITVTNLSTAGSDTYIVKYDSLGQVQWAKSIGGTLGDQPVNMALDAQGNLFVAGYLRSPTLTIAGVTGPITLTNTGSSNIFIVKYNNNSLGEAQWARSIKGSGTIYLISMILDSAGNLYLTGNFYSATIIIEGVTGPITLTNNNLVSIQSDTFIMKCNNSSGQAQWVNHFGGILAEEPVNIISDASGNIYLAGTFTSLAFTIPGGAPGIAPINFTNYATNNDIFIVKYNSLGERQWANHLGGAGNDKQVNMISDAAGNIYMAGYSPSSLLTIPSFTPGITPITFSKSSSNDIFIVKYNSSGDAVWATIATGTGDDRPVNMVLDASENLYVSGFFNSPTLTFRSGLSITNSGGYDAFIAKYDSLGVAQHAKSIGRTGDDLPLKIVFGSAGYIYISGYYSSTNTLT
jgi:hypothetical protein